MSEHNSYIKPPVGSIGNPRIDSSVPPDQMYEVERGRAALREEQARAMQEMAQRPEFRPESYRENYLAPTEKGLGAWQLLDQMEKAIEELNQQIADLHNRIDPVLAPAEPQADQAKDPNRPLTSELVARLSSQLERVYTLTRRVREVAGRVQL